MMSYLFFKRIFDIFFSLICLTLGLPIFILISILILITSGKPIFFKHERLGLKGVKFNCYKFRTMKKNSNTKIFNLIKEDKKLKQEYLKTNKLMKDPRVTKIGKFLRKTSIDEIPQFANILKGDMSLIGPRPIPIDEIYRYGKYADKLLSIKPGLTGSWQTSGRSKLSYSERVEIDMEYINFYNFKKDLLIFFRTFYVLLNPFSNDSY